MSEFAWRPVEIKDIQVGNLVSCYTAKRPRHITRIENKNGIITLFETYDNSEKIYIQNALANHPLDLLINCETKQPVTIEQVQS